MFTPGRYRYFGREEETDSDNRVFLYLYGTTLLRVYGQNGRGWYWEDIRMLSVVLRQESPTVSQR